MIKDLHKKIQWLKNMCTNMEYLDINTVKNIK